jgi:hypothetical protein
MTDERHGWMDTAPAKILFIPGLTNTDDKDVNDILESDDEDEDGRRGLWCDASTLSVTLAVVFRSSFTATATNECACNSGTASDGRRDCRSVEIDG